VIAKKYYRLVNLRRCLKLVLPNS